MTPTPTAGPSLRALRARRLRAGVAALALPLVLATCQVDKLLSPPGTGTLRVSPGTITDSAALGSSAARERNIQLLAVNTSRIGWQAQRVLASNWLIFSAANGTAPDTLVVSLNPVGLATGTYRDTVVVTSSNSDAAPFRVPVEFMVHPCREPAFPLGQVIGAALAATDCASPERPGHYARRYTVAAAAGDSLSIELQTTGFGGFLRVDTVTASPPTAPYPPSLLETDECLGVATDPCIHYWLVPETREYVVEVTSTDPGSTGTFALSVHNPRAPLAPDTLAQRGADSVIVVAAGSTYGDSTIVLRASVSDADGVDTLWLETELRPIGTSFTDVATRTSGPGPVDRRAFARVTGLADDMGYHWQARTVDQTGRTSAWVPANGNPETSPDFNVNITQDPAVPAALAQLRADGITPIPVNGSTDSRSAVFRGTLTDQDPGDLLRLEVEVVPVGTAFVNAPTATSPQVTSGNTATVTVAGLSDNTPYHWQARGVDQSGRSSRWTSFGGNSESSPDFTVLVPATGLEFSVQPTNTVAGAAITPAVQVRALDAQGNTLTSFNGNVTITLASGPPGAVLSGTTTVPASAGIAVFSNLQPQTAGGGYALRATAASLTATSSTFAVTAGAASQLVFTVQPGNTAAGQVITPAVRVTAQDAFGNTATGFTSAVTLSLTNPSGATLGGTTTQTAAAGVAVFNNLFINQAGTGYVLNAASGPLGTTSAAFNITAGPAATLEFTVQPGNTSAGAPIAPAVQVTARDALGNRATGFTNNVTVAIGTNPSGAGTLSGTTTRGAVAGVATFDNLSINLAGNGYTLTAAAGGLSGATSTPFNITPAQATQLAFTVQPSNTGAGSPITPAIQVTARDALGNTVTAFTGAVTLAILNNPGGGTLSGIATRNAVAGVATFPNLSINRSGTGYTLTASAVGTGSTTSAGFTISGGAAAQLLFTTQPTSTTAGTTISPAVQVTAMDALGNVANGYTGSISIAIANNPGGSTLSGTTPVAAAAGVATFSNLSLNKVGTAYTLAASAAGVTGSLSAAFNIAAGPVARLAFTVQPVNTAAGSPITPAVRVTAQDNFGNTITTFGINASDDVTLALGSNPTGTTLLGTTRVRAVSGVATFSDLRINAVGTGYTLIATETGLIADESTPFNITPAPASQIAVNAGNNQTATVNTLVATPPSVIVRDQLNNPVAGVSVTFAVGVGGGAVTLPTAMTDVNGIATVGSWRLGTVAGTNNNTMTATSAGLTGSPVTFTASATAGPATQMALNAGNNQTDTVNSTVTIPPSVIVRDAFSNPVPNRSVTFTVTAGGGSVTSPVLTDANGIAATGWTLGTVAGTNNNTMTAASGAIAGSPVTFTATAVAGPATQMALNAGNNQTASVSDTLPIRPSVIVRDAFGNPVFNRSIGFTVTAGGGTVTPPTVFTDANGIAATRWTLGPAAGTNNNTMTAVSAGLSGSPVTFTASATAGGATQIAVNAGNNQTDTVNSTVTIPPSVIVRDAGNNPVAGVNVTFQVTAGGGSTNPPSTPTVVVATNASGIAALTSWTMGTTAGTNNNTLTATAAGLSGSPVTFTASAVAGPATQIALNAGNNQTAQVNSAVAIPPSVIVRDAFSNPVQGRSITFAVTTGGGNVTSPVSTGANGIAATTWTLGPGAGTNNNTMTATSAGLSGSPVTFTASATAGGATKLAFTAQPTNTVAGVAMTQVQVTAQDAQSNPVTSFTGNVTVAIGTNPQGTGVLSGTNTVAAVGGVASFTTLSIDKSGTGYTLTAASGGLTGATSNSFNITAAAASKLLFDVQPSTTIAGDVISPAVRVRVTDAFGNTVPSPRRMITIALGSNPGSATLGGTLTQQTGVTTGADSGVAIFNNLTVSAIANGYTLAASTAGLTGATSNAFNTTAGTATQLFFTTQPSNTVAGASITPAVIVTARDAFGNTATSFAGAVSVAIGTNPGGGSLGGATAVAAVSGVATFSNLSINNTGTGYTLTTSSGSLTGDTSTPFNITAGGVSAVTSSLTASHATITACSSGCVVGTTASTITVTARDGNSNPVSGASVTISSSGTANTFSPSATGTTNASGVFTATFSSTAAQSKSISATAGGVALTPTAVTVQAAPVSAGNSTVQTSHATITACSTGCSVGTTAATITVTARDQFSNPVPMASVTVSSNGTNNTFAPASGTANGSGVFTATFNSTKAEAKMISATANTVGLTPTAVTVQAAAASSIAINGGNNQSATAGTAVATPPSVIVTDAFGNPVENVSVTFAATVGGGSVDPVTPVMTNSLGIAAVNSWTLGPVAGPNEMTATAGALTGSPVTFSATGT